MYFKSDVFIVVLVFVCSCYCEKFFPSYITQCDVSIANYSDCIKEQINSALPEYSKGIPEMDVGSIDPVELDDIHVDGNGLKLAFTGAKLHGLKDSNINKVNFTIGSDSVFGIVFKTNLSLTATYEMSGKILILPIEGKGDAIVKCNNIEVSFNGILTQTNNSKGEHMKVVSPKYQYKIEKTIFQFKNLFNGSKTLSDTTHKFLNDNWQQLMDDIAPPIIKQIVKTLIKSINKFFGNVTIDDLFKNYAHAYVPSSNSVKSTGDNGISKTTNSNKDTAKGTSKKEMAKSASKEKSTNKS